MSLRSQREETRLEHLADLVFLIGLALLIASVVVLGIIKA